MRQIYTMEFLLQFRGEPSERLLISHGEPPRLSQQMLQTLHSQHELEYFAIRGHDVFAENRGQGCQI